MTFRPRNAYYLRISKNVAIPLFLYLDERHVEWMSDVVLQRVLADLRPLIIPKLQVEKDVHFGPGAAHGNKRGTVEVHRGDTYQFAYFFRKTESHTILFKSRYFVTAPVPPEVASKSAPPRPADRNVPPKRLRTRVSSKQSMRKYVKTDKGRKKTYQDNLNGDELSAGDGESEDGMDASDITPRVLRPVRRHRHNATDTYREDDDGDACQDVVMSSSRETDSSSEYSDVPFANEGNRVPQDENDKADMELPIEEEESPKPLLKLEYQSFLMTGHCLCVVVEPWPPLRAETSAVDSGIAVQHGSFEPGESAAAGQRAKTPLFLPEHGYASDEVHYAQERIFSSVPLFHDTVSTTKDDGHSDDDLINFSQVLNAAGHMHALAADDDDMDGEVLFGDADEVRELF